MLSAVSAVISSRARVGVDVVAPTVQSGTALRSRSSEHEPPNQPGAHQRQLLGDVAAEREPKDVNLLES